MTITTIDSCLRRATVFSACLLVTGWLAAQTVPAKPTSESKPASSAQPAGAAVAATKPHDNTFVIGNDDVLAINVRKEPDISRSIPVRSDGKIFVPLAGEIQAAGRTPLKLERDIASKLQNYISKPEVSVMVKQINSEKFNILGQVARPGSYPLTNSARVLDAITLAGGFRDFAEQKSIYILRQNPRSECVLTTSRQDGCVFTGAASGRTRRMNRRTTRTPSWHAKVQARRPS
jgi:polysaccharide export outer membrane protein